VAVRAKKVYTMSAPAAARGGFGAASANLVENGVVVIGADGKIAAVGPAATTPVPAGVRVIEAEVATPGLVEARGILGLSGIYNSPHDSDQLERSGPIQPELRALDAYNPQEPLVEYARSFGVTTAHTGHAPGELISGQTIIVKLRGNTVEEALVRSPAMVAATLGPSSQKGGAQSPGTRAKQVSMLREQLLKAREFADKRARGQSPADAGEDEPAGAAPEGDAKPPPDKAAPGDRNLRLEMLADVLAGATPLLVTANRAQDIAGALRLAEEFGFKLVLDMASEAYVLKDQVRAAGVPVLLHPTMYRATGETENLSLETASVLVAAGVPVAIQAGYESYVPKTRIVLFEAAIAAANGLSFEQALATITSASASILGVDDRVGSLAAGKDGDVALYSGDPFEYTTRCVAVIIDGRLLSDRGR
jgi:imidazolonepropionase-like amidohydrolase